MNNPYVRAVALGLAAAIATLIAGYVAGEGLGTVEYLTALAAFLAASGLTTAVENRRELRALRERRTTSDQDIDNLHGRLSEVETAISAMDSNANKGRFDR